MLLDQISNRIIQSFRINWYWINAMVTVDKLIIGLLSMICMYNMFRELLLLSMTVSMGMLIFAGLGNLTMINKKSLD